MRWVLAVAMVLGATAAAVAQQQPGQQQPAPPPTEVSNPGAPPLGQQPVTDPVPGTTGTVLPLPPLDLGRAPEGEVIAPDDDGMVEPSAGTSGTVRPLGPLTPLPAVPEEAAAGTESSVGAASDAEAADVVTVQPSSSTVSGGATGNAPAGAAGPAPTEIGGAGTTPPATGTTPADTGTTVVQPSGTVTLPGAPVGVAAPPAPPPSLPAPATRGREVSAKTPPLAEECVQATACYAELSGDLCSSDPLCTSSLSIPGGVTERTQCQVLLNRAPSLAGIWAQGRSAYDLPTTCQP